MDPNQSRYTKSASRALFAARVACGLAGMLGCGQVVPVDESIDMDSGPDNPEMLDDDALASLRVSAPAGLTPDFSPEITAYTASTSLLVQDVTLAAMPASSLATLVIDGEEVQPGEPTPVPLALGTTEARIRVTAADGRSREYTITFERAADIAQYAYGKAALPGEEDRFGASLALWGDTLAVGAPQEDNAATGVHGPGGGNQGDNSAPDSGAVYVFRRAGAAWVQEAYIKASNAEAGDNFGNAVALWGDTLAIAADQEDSGEVGAHPGQGGAQDDDTADSSGAVYVFRRSGDTWAQEAYIKASNTGAGDDFGEALALGEDTLVVGAEDESSSEVGVHGPGGGDQDDDTAIESGAVYVFRRADGAWAQEAYIKASNTGAGDKFGNRVALWSDTLVVSAPDESSSEVGVHGPGGGDQDDDTAIESGAVYVFRRADGAWAQEAYIKASNTGAGDGLGHRIALWGDTLVASAISEDSSETGVHGPGDGDQGDDNASDSGAVYVFRRADGAWAQEAYIKASNAEQGDNFGAGVALWRDLLAVSADDEDSAAAGVYPGDGGDVQDSDGAASSGAVYVFRRAGDAWVQEAYIKASNTEAGDDFGTAVSVWGDALAVGADSEDSNATGVHNGRGDGQAGAPTGSQSDNGSSDSGAVYLFH